MIGIIMSKLTFTFAKALPVIKGVALLAAFFTTAIVTGFPFNDPWFDIVILMGIGSIVGGEPEPDLQLTTRQFLYLWFYRSSHLFISSATAYFLHKNKWDTISGPGSWPQVDRRQSPRYSASSEGD